MAVDCANCGKPGRFLESVSKNAWVDYYRCDACGQLWVYDRGVPNAEPRIVTGPDKNVQPLRTIRSWTSG
jgi:hypothetical protein